MSQGLIHLTYFSFQQLSIMVPYNLHQRGVQSFRSVTTDHCSATLHPSGLIWNPPIRNVVVRWFCARLCRCSSNWWSNLCNDCIWLQFTPNLYSFDLSFGKKNVKMPSLSNSQKYNKLTDYEEVKRWSVVFKADDCLFFFGSVREHFLL